MKFGDMGQVQWNSANNSERTIGRTHSRISKHHSSCLIKGQKRTTRSFLSAHLVDIGHHIYINLTFKVIYRIPLNLYYISKHCLLHTTEVVGVYTSINLIFVQY